MNDAPDSKRTALEAENHQLKADLIRLRDATRTLRERYARLKANGPVIDGASTDADGEREKLAARCEQLVTQLQDKGAECVRLRQRVSELEDASVTHADTDGEHERLWQERSDLKQQVETLLAEQDAATAQHDARAKEHERLQAQLDAQSAHNDELTAQIALLQTQLVEAEERARQVSLDDFDLEEEPPPLPDNASPELAVDDTDRDVEDNESQPENTGPEGDVRDLHNDLAIAQAMLGEAVDELAHAVEHISALDAKAETLSERLAQTDTTVERAEADALADSLTQLQAERDALAESLVQRQSECDAQAQRVEELNELLTLAETQREQANETLAAREQELASLQDDLEGAQAEAARLTEELEILQAWRREQVEASDAGNDEALLTQTQAELDAARESERQLMATLAALQQKLVEQGAQLASVQGEAAAAVEAAYDLRDLIQERDRELIQLRELLDTATQPDQSKA